MLNHVTRGFYNRSFHGLWMYEVIGREYDQMEYWAQNIRFEIFPQKCTWSIPIWEWMYGFEPDDTLTLEFRRGRIMSKIFEHPPINPERIAAALSAFTGCPVRITDPIAPYTFRIIMDESETTIFNHPAVLKLLRTIKPSHLSFKYEVFIQRKYFVTDYHAGAFCEYIREYHSEETEIITDAVDYSAGTAAEYTREYHIGDISAIQTDVTDYHAGVENSYVREYIWEENPINENAVSYDGGAASEIIKEVHTE